MRSAPVVAALLAVLLLPAPAQAGGIIMTQVFLWINAITGSAALANIGGALAFGAVVAYGASVLNIRTPSQPRQRQQLEQPTSQPPVRFVYGRTRAAGTPLKPLKQGRIVYGCLILNSRPSAGGAIDLLVDGRACTYPAEWGKVVSVTGDPPVETVTYDKYATADVHDFDDEGMGVFPKGFPKWRTSDDGEDFLRVWIGLGDQVKPPQRIVDETDGYFSASDAGTGTTVLWYRMDIGKDQELLFKRWKTWPRPPSFDVVMDYALVWDPSDEAQDPDDHATWTYSDDHTRVLLDAIRQNPVEPWPDDHILLESFAAAQVVSEEAVALLNGGTEPRYRVAGILTWSETELMTQILPLERAGAGRLFTSGGKLGYVSGAYTAPAYTLTDVLSSGELDFAYMQPASEVPRRLVASYTRPQREYETATLPALDVRGGQGPEATIDLAMVTSASQAQRVLKIEAARLAAQKSLSCVAPPSAVVLLPGATFTCDLDGLERMDGTYQVRSANPGLWVSELGGDGGGGGGVALRVPLTAHEEAAAFYAWTPATDEAEIVDPLLPLKNVELAAGAGAGEVTASGNVQGDAEYTQVRLYRAATGAGFSASVPADAAQTVTPGSGFSLTFTGVGAGTADFFLVPWSADSLGPPDGPHAITVT